MLSVESPEKVTLKNERIREQRRVHSPLSYFKRMKVMSKHNFSLRKKGCNEES